MNDKQYLLLYEIAQKKSFVQYLKCKKLGQNVINLFEEEIKEQEKQYLLYELKEI